MLAQCCAKLYWSASCVMYVAGPYTSLRFLFSMRTTTSWSKLPLASGEMVPGLVTLVGEPNDTSPDPMRATTNRRAEAERAPRTRFVRECISARSGARHHVDWRH